MHHAVARQRRVLLVQREHAAGEPLVLKRLAQPPSVRDREAVVAEAGGALPRQLGHLGQLASPGWPLVIAARKPTGHDAPRRAARSCSERSTERRVDDRVGVRHREDRAEAAGRRGARAGLEVLLVLAPGRAQVHVRVDERREQRAGPRLDQLASRRARSSAPGAPISAISPSRTSRSWTPSRPARGSSRRAPRTSSVAGSLASRHADAREARRLMPAAPPSGTGAGPARPRAAARQQLVEDRHPHHEPGRDLLGDQRLRRVDHLGGQLDAAVHRARGASAAGAAAAGGCRSGSRRRTRAARARRRRPCARAASAARRRRPPRRGRRGRSATSQPSASTSRGISVGGPADA